jgi:hypothetical protein
MLALFDANFTLCEYLEKRNGLNSEFYDAELLRRAKLGLHSLAFFGLAEEQDLNRRLFSCIFNHKFVIKRRSLLDKRFARVANIQRKTSEEVLKSLNASVLQQIVYLNRLSCISMQLNCFMIESIILIIIDLNNFFILLFEPSFIPFIKIKSKDSELSHNFIYNIVI